MWPAGHSGYCSLLWAAVAAICHETRPGEALQYPGCTPFKITQEGAGAGREQEEGSVMEEEEAAERARCTLLLLLVVTEAGKDNRRRHMAGERRHGTFRLRARAQRALTPLLFLVLFPHSLLSPPHARLTHPHVGCY